MQPEADEQIALRIAHQCLCGQCTCIAVHYKAKTAHAQVGVPGSAEACADASPAAHLWPGHKLQTGLQHMASFWRLSANCL